MHIGRVRPSVEERHFTKKLAAAEGGQVDGLAISHGQADLDLASADQYQLVPCAVCGKHQVARSIAVNLLASLERLKFGGIQTMKDFKLAQRQTFPRHMRMARELEGFVFYPLQGFVEFVKNFGGVVRQQTDVIHIGTQVSPIGQMLGNAG